MKTDEYERAVAALVKTSVEKYCLSSDFREASKGCNSDGRFAKLLGDVAATITLATFKEVTTATDETRKVFAKVMVDLIDSRLRASNERLMTALEKKLPDLIKTCVATHERSKH